MNSTLFYLLHEGSGLPIGGSGGRRRLSLPPIKATGSGSRDSLEDMPELYSIPLTSAGENSIKPLPLLGCPPHPRSGRTNKFILIGRSPAGSVERENEISISRTEEKTPSNCSGSLFLFIEFCFINSPRNSTL